MSVALGFYTLLLVIFLFVNKKIKGSLFDGFFFVMVPYYVIILINNLFMLGLGFDAISEKIIYLFCLTSFLFFLASLLAYYLAKPKSKLISTSTFYSLDFKALKILTIILLAIVFVSYMSLVRTYGFTTILSQGDTVEWNWISQHSLIILSVLSVFLFDNYLRRKDVLSLILSILAVLMLFLTFVKYHIISTILCFVIYIAFTHPKLTKKIGIISLICIVLIFVGNYAINFFSQGIDINKDFYIIHLWKYIAGGVSIIEPLNDYLSNASLSLGGWIGNMIFVFPDMITNRIIGAGVSTYSFYQMVPLISIGVESTNVVCIPGSAYIQCGNNLVIYSLFVLGWGFLVEFLFTKARRSYCIPLIIVSTIFITFNLLSFFSSFFELSRPVEMMVVGFLISIIFKKRGVEYYDPDYFKMRRQINGE